MRASSPGGARTQLAQGLLSGRTSARWGLVRALTLEELGRVAVPLVLFEEEMRHQGVQ